MTQLLETAIAKMRGLPDAMQDEAAEVLFAIASRIAEPIRLDAETRAAVREGLAQAKRGDFATEDEMAALFTHPGG